MKVGTRLVRLAFGVLLTCASFSILTNNVSAANGSAGNGGGYGGGGGGGGSIGSGAGGGWFWFPWGTWGAEDGYIDADGNIVYKGQSGFPDGVIGKECADVGGYYVSSWYHFLHGESYRGLVGVAMNSTWAPNGGNIPYGNPRADLPVEDLNEVKARFIHAQSLGIVPAGTDWNSVGWFCYSEDLEMQEGQVHATSTVEAEADGASYSETSNQDGFVGLKISADWDSTVKLTFSHEFTFSPKEGTTFPGDVDRPFDEIYRYSGTDAYGDDIGGKSPSNNQIDDKKGYAEAKWSSDAKLANEAAGNTYSEKVEKTRTIKIKRDEGKNNTYTTSWICRKVGNYATQLTFGTDSVDYSVKRSTKACVKITFVKNPSGNPGPYSAGVSGDDETGTMFIGEGSSIGWKSTATSAPTRRLEEYQAIRYLVSPNVQNHSSVRVAGDSRASGSTDPCKLVSNKVTVTGCSSAKSKNWRKSDSNSDVKQKIEEDDEGKPFYVKNNPKYEDEDGVVVPEVYSGATSALGAKYCNTMGYKFQYWYAVNRKNGGSTNIDKDEWHRVSGKDYWYIFPSACSVIAKRPEVAVWNGSVFAPGGVNTALSQRYADTTMGKLTSDTSKNRVFGSWDEYLIIANGSIKGMASASAIANGKTSNKSEQLSVAYNEKGESNSRMTIQNLIKSTGLGHADISASENYASNMSNLATGTDRHEGDFTIDSNIISSGNFATNSLPQRIIYVNGNLKIKSNVERIDAWLLVTGEIDTCSDVTNSNLSSTTCNRPLQFNGPVMAKNIKLRRTNGAENSDAATPAEVFNLRPDAYIWAYHKSIDPGDTGYDYKVVNSRELAPRF